MIFDQEDEGDMEIQIPEFFPPGYTSAVCASLLSARELDLIEKAAFLAHDGQDFGAERLRACANYDYAWRRADRAYRGLPAKLPPTSIS